MKKVMWAVYNSANSKTPRAIFSNSRDADRYHEGFDWGITVRVEIELTEQTTVVLRTHEYRYVEPNLNRNKMYGKSTFVTNSFLASCEAGESVEYHHPDYVVMSRKRFSEVTSKLIKNGEM